MISCNNNKISSNLTTEKEEEYKGYLNYPMFNGCFHCDKSLYKNVIFNIKMQYPFDFNKNDYEFMIIRESGVIYRGGFSAVLEISNVCFCLDSNLSILNTLAFVLVDKTNKIVYKWYKKECYYLYKKDVINIVLKNDGSYKIAFN